MKKTMRPYIQAAVIAISMFAAVAALSAYRGHGNDIDTAALSEAYPATKGTMLDDCATCHRSGDVPDELRPGRLKRVNACDYCHIKHVEIDGPASATLNPFAKDYLKSGRDAAALKLIARRDSDKDGVSNAREIAAGTNPGDAQSKPSMKFAPSVIMDFDDVRLSAPVLEQTVFLNSTKSRAGDTYSRFRGVRIIDLARAAGLSSRARSIDVIAADGYMMTFTLEELEKSYEQGAPVFGLDKEKLGDCGWARYSAPGLAEGKPLPPANILLAFEEDGKLLEPASYDKVRGRITGDGPFRSVVPQRKISPPDLPQTADPACSAKVPPAHRFSGLYDHNAGSGIKAVVAIRVNPLPSGTRDIDWRAISMKNLREKKIAVYGALSPAAVSISQKNN